jgi:hypothetical protein
MEFSGQLPVPVTLLSSRVSITRRIQGCLCHSVCLGAASTWVCSSADVEYPAIKDEVYFYWCFYALLHNLPYLYDLTKHKHSSTLLAYVRSDVRSENIRMNQMFVLCYENVLWLLCSIRFENISSPATSTVTFKTCAICHTAWCFTTHTICFRKLYKHIGFYNGDALCFLCGINECMHLW